MNNMESMYGAACTLFEYKTNMCDKYIDIVLKAFGMKHEYY